MANKWTEKDTARETGDSMKKVSEAFHTARNDAAEAKDQGVPENRHGDNDGGDSGK